MQYTYVIMYAVNKPNRFSHVLKPYYYTYCYRQYNDIV